MRGVTLLKRKTARGGGGWVLGNKLTTSPEVTQATALERKKKAAEGN